MEVNLVRARSRYVPQLPISFDSCSPFASTRIFGIFRTGISSRASLDGLLVVRLEGAVSCMLTSATVSCPFRPAHCNEDTPNYGV